MNLRRNKVKKESSKRNPLYNNDNDIRTDLAAGLKVYGIRQKNSTVSEIKR